MSQMIMSRSVPLEHQWPARDRWTTARHRLGTMMVRLIEGPGIQVWSWRLPSSLRSVARARRLTRERLSAWGMEKVTDVAELLVSELVTNALCHARGPIRLALSATEGMLRCEVEDGGTVLPRLYNAHEDDEGGRGLCLLDMLACCWGAARTANGKVMWFELPAD
ncbi:ATP-binding protein [Planotetraspora sp. A-T 1434]|uniref:ATP-binding protein n=1 Tax=Planotetraspora sp. A-T 1434 TaxID=2979219 RepID=UPI0021BE5586|nr:ATP-binding protein [Planotetraspora sp. A-T 1434]MCT9932328.1 ATP-binding protein [Planotetraspora sp. A-T 1434]